MLEHVQQRLPRLLEDPIVFAHRGGRAHAPENSLEAFLLALRLGANGLETDVWVTNDGIPVVDHDGYRRRAFGKQWIRDYDYRELPFAVPTLDHVLGALPDGSFSLSIDVKDPAAFDGVIDVAKRWRELSTVYLCHPELPVLEQWRQVNKSVNLVHSTSMKSLTGGPEHHAAQLALLGIRVCNMHHTDWSGGLTALYHRFGILAFAWDIQHQSLAATLLRMGIDGLFGDDVAALHEALTDVR